MTELEKAKLNLCMQHIEQAQKDMSEAWNSLLYYLQQNNVPTGTEKE